MLGEIEAVSSTASDFLSQLNDMSPQMLSAAALVALNLLLRRVPRVPNWTIPFISTLAGVAAFVLLVPPEAKAYNPVGRNIVTGGVVGLVAWLAYDKIVVVAERRWPWLAGVINGEETKNPDGTKGTDTPTN